MPDGPNGAEKPLTSDRAAGHHSGTHPFQQPAARAAPGKENLLRRHLRSSRVSFLRRPVALALAAGLFLAAGAVAVRAAGIDCAKAASPVERMICADPALRRADGEVAGAFAAALDLTDDAPGLRASQRQWLAGRNACPDAACLATAYAARNTELTALAASARQTLAAERARLRAVLGWPQTCEDAYQELVSPKGRDMALPTTGVTSYPLGDGRKLFLVQCDLFAYQASFTALLQDRPDGPGRLLSFPTFERDGGATTRRMETELVGNPVFDPAAGTLTLFTKARGLGDCGALTVYAFPARGGPTVVSTRVRECTDTPRSAPPPERWPLVKIPARPQ